MSLPNQNKVPNMHRAEGESLIALMDKVEEEEESEDELQQRNVPTIDGEPKQRNPCPFRDFVEALRAEDVIVVMRMLPEKAGAVSTASYMYNFDYDRARDYTFVYEGATPLLLAMQRNREDVVQALLEGGARGDAKDRCGTTALHMAAWHGNLQLIKLFVSLFCDPNAKIKNHTKSYTPLHFAVEGGNIEAVKTLLALGADICVTYEEDDEEDDYEFDLLQIAVCYSSKPEMVKYLIEIGYPLRVDRCQRNLLNVALSQDGWGAGQTDPTVLKLLLEAGVDPLQECDEGRTPLWCAARGDSCLPLQTFIDFGVPLNSSKSMSPLYGAVCGQSNLQAVLLLLAHGCDTEQIVWGSTAYQTAYEDDVKEALENHGCVVDN